MNSLFRDFSTRCSFQRRPFVKANNRTGFAVNRVVPKGLELLLSRELVKRFRRTSGWAVIGKDPVRYPDNKADYSGLERRIAA